MMIQRTIQSAMLLLVISTSLLFSNSYHLEAEDAALQGVQVSKSRSGYSGSGYVTGFDSEGDQVVFTFDGQSGIYDLTIGYASEFGDKGYDLNVNGQKSTGMFSGPQRTFAEHKAGKFLLRTGKNMIIIGKGWGWFEVDYIKLNAGEVRLPLKPEKKLVVPNASKSTQSLLAYLIDQYGEKSISGQYDLQEIEYIKSKTGKSPAIGCFDLIEYSPSRIAHGANPSGSVEKWIRWALDGGGIVSLCWHWNAPTDLKNEPGNEWWSGFYTRATTFDLKQALANKSSERYQLLLRDMDAIARELTKFRQSDIPVLWRPLHEAAGGWFWWGAKGAEPYIELWRLMFDRFTRKHGLNNLIWVCTPNSFHWYPGDDVVDIIGLDIYTEQSSSMSGEWENALNHIDGVKMIALSESGTMPDPDNVRTFATWWSWFALWTGPFIREVPLSLLYKTYHDRDIITLDELPDWRDYQDSGAPMDVPENFALMVYPNPGKSNIHTHLLLPHSAEVKLEVYNSIGQKIRSIYAGVLEQGRHINTINCDDLVSGVYWVRIKAGERRLIQKFSILK